MGKRFNYTYRVKFPSQRWFYFGLHSTNDLNDGYCGSPHTHREKWENYKWEFEILEFFDTREEAAAVEHRLIKTFLNDSDCLNENCGTAFSIETARKGGQSGKPTITEKHITRNSEAQRLKSLKAKESPKFKEHIGKLTRHNVESGHLKRISQESAVQRSKPIIVTFPDGTEKEFFGAAEAERQLPEFNVNRVSIGRCALGKQKSHQNLKFRFK